MGERIKKIIVIGCLGSGKSTFSKQLNNVTGIPLYNLNMLYWNFDKTVARKDIFKEKLQDIISKEAWIIDGNYGSTMEPRLKACDTVFFLDYPVEVCLDGIKLRKGKVRTDMPWVEDVDEEDEELITFVKDYNHISRPIIMKLLNKYAMKNVIIFKDRKCSQEYLYKIQL